MKFVRDNESRVAGHSEQTYYEHYDTKAREAASILVSALQTSKRDTIGPVEDLKLPARDIDKDRMIRLEALRKQKVEQRKKVVRNFGFLSSARATALLELLKTADKSLLKQRKSMSLKKWGRLFFQLICSSVRGKACRDVIVESVRMEKTCVVKFIARNALKLKLGKELQFEDLDILYQLMAWGYGVQCEV